MLGCSAVPALLLTLLEARATYYENVRLVQPATIR